MGALGIEGGAVAAQAVGHPEATPFEGLEAGLADRVQGREGPLVRHHRRQPQQPGVEVAAELVGHHHRGAAGGIDGVVLAVPEQGIEMAPGLLQPAAEAPLLLGGVEPQLQLQLLADGQGRLQGGDPEGAAVGADTLQGPVVEGLVRGAAVVGQPVIVDVEALEVIQGGHRRRPAVRQEADVRAAGGQAVGAPHLQHEIAGQVLPEVAVLVGGVIGGVEGALVGGAEVVGGGAGHLAGGFHPAAALGEVPADRTRRGIGGRDGAGEAAQHRLVELGPELQQGEGAVEPHVEAFVPGVVEALEHPEVAHRIARAGGRPEAAAAGQVVELVEQGHAQRLRQVVAPRHRRLPGLDRGVPVAPFGQGFGGDGGGAVAVRAEEVGVAAQGPGAGGEGRHRQIPADHHGDLEGGPGLQPEAHRHGGAEGIVAGAAAVVVTVGNRAVAAEGLPEFRPVATGIPAAAAEHLHPRVVQGRRLGHRQTPLPFPLRQGLGALPFQQQALETVGVDPAVALPLAAADRRHVVVLRAAVVPEVDRRRRVGVGEPADRVAPAQQQRQLQRPVGGVGQRPGEDGDRVAGAPVVAGKDRAEGLAARVGAEHGGVVVGADRVAHRHGAARLLRSGGGVPAPGGQGRAGAGAGRIGHGSGRQGMGPSPVAVPLEEGELAVGQHAEPVLAAVEVPEVEGAVDAPPQAAGAEAPQGHAVVGAIVEVAGVAHRVGLAPTLAEGPRPAGLGGLPGAPAAPQVGESGEAEGRHGAGRGGPSLSELATP